MVQIMNAAAIRSEWVGRVVDGRFALLQWLGGSESGGVFLTELGGDGSQKAAIKLIPADLADAEACMARWMLTRTLSHPHLMRLFHSGRCEIDSVSMLYVVSEYAEEVLSQILPERPLTPVETREMLDPVLDALSYLHGRGFVHGHVKPSNIMVAGDQLKLSSDCLHVAGEPGKHFSAPGVYDAPECAAGAISTASDVWSLGVTLVEALTQYPPVWDRSTQTEPVVPESIPQPFADIARECLRREPARRCTLGEIKARLDPAQPIAKPAGKAPASETGQAAPAKRRWPALIAAALVLIAVVAAMQLRSHQTKPSPPAAEQRPAPAIAAPPPQSPVPEAQTSSGGTVKGAVAERVLPDILPSASESIRGQVNVTIRATVDASGDVSNAALDSPGPSKYFAKVALQAAQHWRFKPAQVDGEAVSSVWILRFHFEQAATEVTPVEVSP